MEKNRILKLCIMFICMFFIFVIGNNVYGYQLSFKGVSTANKDGIIVRTYANTYGSKSEYDINDSKKAEEITSPSLDYFSFDFGYFNTYKIVFHGAPATNYINGWYSNGTSSIDVGYDKSNKILDESVLSNSIDTTAELEKEVHNEKATLMSVNTSIYNNGLYNSDKTLSYERGQKDFFCKKYFYIKTSYYGKNGSQQTVTVSNWFISKNAVESLQKKFLSNGNNVVYFSLPAKTGVGGAISLDNAYDTVKYMYTAEYEWGNVNRGLTDGGYAFPYNQAFQATGKFELSDMGQSIVNLFDNKLVLPSEFTANQQIYVRHVDEKGNLLNIANPSEVLIGSDGVETIKLNDTAGNKHTEYQEFYSINLGQRLRVSRALKMAENGKLYKYKYAVITTGKGKFEDVKKNDNINTNSNKINSSSFEVGQSNDDKAITLVTCVYSEGDVPGNNNDNPPSGDIHTDFSADNNTEGCIQKYTPTNSYITPYLKASKILLKDLVYKLEKNGNNVYYKIQDFNVKKLTGGRIDNNDKHPETGEIFGDNLNTLFNSNESHNLEIKDFELTEANSFKNAFNNGTLPEQSNINNFAEKQVKSDYNDFNIEKNKKFIPYNKYNGLRTPKLYANYKAVNVMNNTEISGVIDEKESNNKLNVIVYNPLDLEQVTVTTKKFVDHTTKGTNNNVIQKNAEFTLNFGTKGSTYYASISDTIDYLDYYYLFFDFDVVLKSDYDVIEYSNNTFNALGKKSSGFTVKAGNLIKINKNDKEFKGIASSNVEGEDIVAQIENNIVLIGVTNNMPSSELENLVSSNAVKMYQRKNTSVEEELKKYTNIDKTSNAINFKNYCDEDVNLTSIHEGKYTGGKNMYEDAYYFAIARTTTTNVGRIYDFKVTDCSDIDYKSVFRKSDNGTVNDLTNVQYFSGVKLFNIYSTSINSLEDRTDINIGSNSNSKKIIPLGPYKNTNTSYISAPKMGYRISFDLKTSGYYDYKNNGNGSTREILIKPSYYYISKDGNVFKNNINLYYKNSSGKYVKFNGSDYTIYFKPKDGYRSISNSVTAGNTTLMSEQLEPLNIGSNNGFTLNSKMMSTADNKFIQAWYGEFKLPNSIIAVEGTNISNPLSDGYIGVVFDIECIDNKGKGNEEKRISYNENNKNDTDDKNQVKPNTTQWDYEGFLGFTNYGNEVEKLLLQLEKGTWEINNERYQQIKGTVVLFDLDNRAANDFD